MKPTIPPLKLTESEWYTLPTPEKALLIAAQFCDVDHVKEEPVGSNRGPWVDSFLSLARAEAGQPWSAAFVAACEIFAGKDHYSANFGEGVRYPGSVTSWMEWARGVGRWSRTPRRGRIFVIARAGHSRMGFVTKANADGTFATIEGDSTVGGLREGCEVCRRTRSIDGVSGFIDLV